MFYYLSVWLTPDFGVLNLFSYHTVRAAGAMVTGFAFCILVGPRLIAALQRLKVGQYIREQHVQDLHALHKNKAGTPTMGGTMIIVSTVLSLLLWSTLTNRLMLVATAVLCLMGAVGFVDDYIKLRRKDNDGLSARAKLVGQVLTGGALGIYLVLNPITYGASYLSSRDILDWERLAEELTSATGGDSPTLLSALFSERLSAEVRHGLASGIIDPATQEAFVVEANRVLELKNLYDETVWKGTPLNSEAASLLAKGVERLKAREALRLNRLLLEAAAPGIVEESPRHLHTDVGIPGMKDVLIPMGIFYVLFVVLIIVGASNAVNLTDGLDGLAVGASVISIFAFTGIAYVVSRADWSDYLYVLYVPEASELTVFGAALLGTGLGFLWFNAHPAEVFMGDTGSLALGGVIGALAVLTKQELLLPIVGGLFVIEALSVIIQVASFKLTGKRVFRMAPLHHHFELKGWSESKVTIRFWILALLFALMSLATLKLR